MTSYRVIADHPVLPTLRTTITVHPDRAQFYATHRDLGCGKSYDTEKSAITNLLEDHAYIVLLIEKVEG